MARIIFRHPPHDYVEKYSTKAGEGRLDIDFGRLARVPSGRELASRAPFEMAPSRGVAHSTLGAAILLMLGSSPTGCKLRVPHLSWRERH